MDLPGLSSQQERVSLSDGLKEVLTDGIVPGGSAMILSMTSSADCVPTGISQSGQYGVPSRAMRIRR